MRIATTQYSATMNRALQLASARVELITQKMATGNKLLLPSDDPVTGVRLSRLAREEAAVKQYRDNIGALKVRLTQNETALDTLTADQQEARDLMVWALDGANSAEDVTAMSNALESIAESLFYSANAKDQEGGYLFSGTATATAAISYDATAALGSRYSFTGNTATQRVVVGLGVTQSANVTVDETDDLLNLLEGTIATLQVPGVDVNDATTRAQLTATLDGIDTAMGSVGAKIAGLGGVQNIVDTLDANLANVSLSNGQAVIDLGSLDYGAAAVELSAYTTALKSTQQAYAKVSQLSLFDLI
jgi:flagellar hook-associated protein 3 FlgL